mgnify:CR=1 FL=1
MNEINNDEIKTILYDISKNIILPKYKNLKKDDIQFKNNKDLVTIVDIAVEKELQKTLNLFLPNALFVGEESFANKPEIIEGYNEKVRASAEANKILEKVDRSKGTTIVSPGCKSLLEFLKKPLPS